MHGAGGQPEQLREPVSAGAFAAQGIAGIGIDQRRCAAGWPGATADGTNYSNPPNPDALRDNRCGGGDRPACRARARAALDRSTDLLASAVPGAGFTTTSNDPLTASVMYVSHRRGATRDRSSSASRTESSAEDLGRWRHLLGQHPEPQAGSSTPGSSLRDLVEILLGGPVDLFHPRCTCCRWAASNSDPAVLLAAVREAPQVARRCRSCSHGTADGYVPTPMVTAMVVGAGYPLLAPTFLPISFPELPGHQYQEAS